MKHLLPYRRILTTLLFLVLLATSASARDVETPLRVTVTVPPLVWLVSEVAGPDVVIDHLVKVGDTPETFQPTDLQITRVARSKLFFRIGVPAENGPWLRALAKSGTIEVVDLRQGLELRTMDAHHHGHHHHGPREDRAADAHAAHASDHMDPHIWLSPRRLEIMASTIARHLAAVDPQHADRYKERAAAVVARLRTLDSELAKRLEPVHGRAFFIFHPAWGYFADDYGLRQIAIEIEGKEPTEQELTQLVRQARKLGVRAFFVQPEIHSTTPATLARLLDVRLETLDCLALDLPGNLQLAAERLLAALLPEGEGA